MRLLREILTDTVEEAAGRAATACRITLDELLGDGITRAEIEEVLGELGEIPDLWDFAMGTWEDDSATSRFGAEGGEEQYVAGLKALTSKPVVGVGRFTSPGAMVRMVHQGILDFIGAARPSIADPYLPQKIEEGRLEDIRECIGCNICVTGDFTMSPIRCTQNPSMGAEWRRGWHPEVYRGRHADGKILVVGAGPAGLDAEAAVLVTARLLEDSPLTDLRARHHEWPDLRLRSARAIGDALAPGTIAAAVWEGRRFAEELENPTDDADATPYRREVTQLTGQQE